MEFATFVITQKGQALMAKLMQGTGTCDFSAIKLSSQTYTDAQLATLTNLANIKQTAPITSKRVVNTTAIQIDGAVDNRLLTVGYNINTIGIYAIDPDEGEILYAAARALTAGYMPPYNGVTVSGGYFKFVISVGAASQVTLTVDPAGYASIGDVQQLQSEIADLKGYIGLNDATVYGLEVDFPNRRCTRIAGAVGKTPGTSFDGIAAFGGRYRCNLTDGGVEVAKYGDVGYTETGALTSAITIGETTYPVGTKVQVMVKQPKFYYKVVPLVVDKISGGRGYHMRKARYYVSDTPRDGFKLHPLFKGDKDFVYLSAYEGSLYDESASAYILDDSQVADFTASTGDKLCSIANAKPMSGLTQNATRRNTGILAENRGSGWYQSFAEGAAATQLLFMIEYGTLNWQTALGAGVTNKASGEGNESELTGATTNLGNGSGSVQNENNYNVITYRGEENVFGNIWKWVDGMNIYSDGGNTDHHLYICNNKTFAESKNNDNYEEVNFTVAMADGYVNAFGYDPEFDWLFIPSETGNGASTSVPVGDYFYQSTASAGYRVAILGGIWYNGTKAGGFCWDVGNTPSDRGRNIGGRLAYVPA